MVFQRARSAGAKQQREGAILAAAARLGAERGIRQVPPTDIADAVGLHKSAMLRYFETREQIFLRLTADGWREWSAALRAELDGMAGPDPAAWPEPAGGAGIASPDSGVVAAVAAVFAGTLAARGAFCDLLAQAPLNLERNVSVGAVGALTLVTLAEVALIPDALQGLLPTLSGLDAVDLIATATSLSGALWQMATPGPEIAALY